MCSWVYRAAENTASFRPHFRSTYPVPDTVLGPGDKRRLKQDPSLVGFGVCVFVGGRRREGNQVSVRPHPA